MRRIFSAFCALVFLVIFANPASSHSTVKPNGAQSGMLQATSESSLNVPGSLVIPGIGQVYSIIWPQNGKIIAILQGATVSIYDQNHLCSQCQLKEIRAPESGDIYNPIASIALSNDGTRLVSATTNGVVMLWDVASGKQITTVATIPGTSPDVAFSPDGKQIAYTAQLTLKIYDVVSGTNTTGLTNNDNPQNEFDRFTNITFSPDETLLAIREDVGDEIVLFDLATAKDIFRFLALINGRGHDSVPVLAENQDSLDSVAFSFNGKLLAIGGNRGLIDIYDISNPSDAHKLTTLEGHKGGVNRLSFRPDGRLLASGGDDGIVRLWDVTSGKQIAALIGGEAHVHAIAFSPDGSQLLSGDDQGEVWLWDLRNAS